MSSSIKQWMDQIKGIENLLAVHSDERGKWRLDPQGAYALHLKDKKTVLQEQVELVLNLERLKKDNL